MNIKLCDGDRALWAGTVEKIDPEVGRDHEPVVITVRELVAIPAEPLQDTEVERLRRLAGTSQDVGKLSRAIEDACDEILRLRSALYEVERYFGDELPPAGFPMGVIRAASNQETRDA